VDKVPGSSTIKVAQIDTGARITPIYFVEIKLEDKDGELLSTNFYWQSVAQDDFARLMDMPRAKIEANASMKAEGDNTELTVKLHNATPVIALMTHMQLHQKGSGKRVLPVFYSDNYLSLVPGESRTITIEAATKNLLGEAPLVEIDGFNVDVAPGGTSVAVGPNVNAQPEHWPGSQLVVLPVQ